jgi:hypothetical protein
LPALGFIQTQLVESGGCVCDVDLEQKDPLAQRHGTWYPYGDKHERALFARGAVQRSKNFGGSGRHDVQDRV